ncbi:hypothetical protein [Poseidonocella sp. HB161398]|uniref:hypothetical protein n=1 Tax=Poseidonocella sp. HB161398 TaxID=2320855 RepID=UPI001109FFC5|nr:hypothetical protein [Poseidonocella sp. HB161398]
MARPFCALRGALCVFAVLLAALALQTAPASAGSVPHFRDFTGGTCIRAADLETAYREGFKGTRPPPLCIEHPCSEELGRRGYSREILGREATDGEWDTYLSARAQVCSSADPGALAQLVPEEEPEEPMPMVTQFLAAEGHAFPLGDPVALPGPPPVESHLIPRPDGQRERSDPFDIFIPDGIPPGDGASGPRPHPGPGGTGPGGTWPSEVAIPPVPVLPGGLALASALALAALLRRRR